MYTADHLRGFMKKMFNTLLATSFLFSTIVMSHASALPTGPTAGASQKEKKDATEKSAMEAILQSVLNQLVAARLDFNLEVSGGTEKINGEKKSTFNLNYLDFSALAQFKDGFVHEFVDDAKVDPQFKKVVPRVKFGIDNLQVIAKGVIQEKGSILVRFCQDYSLQNDKCNTFDDTKLLKVTVESGNFAKMLEVKLKDIKIEFEQKLAAGKLKFKGTCTAFKSGFDALNAASVMKPVDCSFDGVYDANSSKMFSYGFKFRNKVP
jgi:hypothetical protein